MDGLDTNEHPATDDEMVVQMGASVSNIELLDAMVRRISTAMDQRVALSEQQMTTRLRAIEERLVTITNTLEVLMDAIATDNRLSGAVVVAGQAQSAITRAVVTILSRHVITGSWSSIHANRPFPVAHEYLDKIVTAVFQPMSAVNRRELGRKFAAILRHQDVIVDVRSVLGILARTDTPDVHTFKSRFFEVSQTLSGRMAFLLPPEMTAHLAGLKSLNQDGGIEDGRDNRQRGDVCSEGRVYNAIDEDVTTSSKYIKCIEMHRSESSMQRLTQVCKLRDQMPITRRTKLKEDNSVDFNKTYRFVYRFSAITV